MAFKRSAVRSRLSPPKSSEILGFRDFFFLFSSQIFVISAYVPLERLLIPTPIRNGNTCTGLYVPMQVIYYLYYLCYLRCDPYDPRLLHTVFLELTGKVLEGVAVSIE